MERKSLRTRSLILLFSVAICLTNSGCLMLAAGAAAGAGGYAYYKGNVTDTFDGDFAAVWQATHAAMGDLGLPVVTVTQDAHSGVIESVTGTEEKLRIRIEENTPSIPTDPPHTTVSIRVATFGDQEVSRRIHRQIHTRLATARPVAVAPLPGS